MQTYIKKPDTAHNRSCNIPSSPCCCSVLLHSPRARRGSGRGRPVSYSRTSRRLPESGESRLTDAFHPFTRDFIMGEKWVTVTTKFGITESKFFVTVFDILPSKLKFKHTLSKESNFDLYLIFNSEFYSVNGVSTLGKRRRRRRRVNSRLTGTVCAQPAPLVGQVDSSSPFSFLLSIGQ